MGRHTAFQHVQKESTTDTEGRLWRDWAHLNRLGERHHGSPSNNGTKNVPKIAQIGLTAAPYSVHFCRWCGGMDDCDLEYVMVRGSMMVVFAFPCQLD